MLIQIFDIFGYNTKKYIFVWSKRCFKTTTKKRRKKNESVLASSGTKIAKPPKRPKIYILSYRIFEYTSLVGTKSKKDSDWLQLVFSTFFRMNIEIFTKCYYVCVVYIIPICCRSVSMVYTMHDMAMYVNYKIHMVQPYDTRVGWCGVIKSRYFYLEIKLKLFSFNEMRWETSVKTTLKYLNWTEIQHRERRILLYVMHSWNNAPAHFNTS